MSLFSDLSARLQAGARNLGSPSSREHSLTGGDSVGTGLFGTTDGKYNPVGGASKSVSFGSFEEKARKGVMVCKAVTFDGSVACGARVGDNKVCICKATDCLVSAHQRKKADDKVSWELFDSPVMVGLRPISSRQKTTVLSDLTIPASSLPDGILDQWTQDEAVDLEVWRARFAAAQGPKDEFTGCMTPAKLRRNMESVMEADAMLKECTTTGEFIDPSLVAPEDWAFSPSRLVEKMEMDDDFEELLSLTPEEQSRSLLNKVSTVAKGVDRAEGALLELGDTVSTHLPALQVAAGKLSYGVKALSLDMGSRPASSGYSTVWGGLCDLAATVGELEGKVSSNFDFSAMDEQIRRLAQEASRAATTPLTERVNVLESFKAESEVWFKDATGAITGLMARVNQPSSQGQAPAQSSMSGSNSMNQQAEIDALKVAVRRLTTDLATQRAPAASQSPFSFSAPPQANLVSRLDKIQDELSFLKSSGQEGSVTMGDHHFRSLEDCLSWNLLHNPDSDFGLLMDPLVALGNLVHPTADTKAMETRKKVGFRSETEELAFISLSRTLPYAFHSGDDEDYSCDEDTSPLNKLKAHKDWQQGTGGLKKHLLERLNAKMLHWNKSATTKYSSRPEMLSLTLLMLTETQAFLQRVFHFVSEKYDNLVIISKFSSKQAWSLTMRLFKRVWDDLHKAKMAFYSDVQLDDRAATAGTMLWTSLLSLRVARAYMENDISNHPGISAAYVEFLSIRSGTEGLAVMRVELDGFTSRFKSLEKEVKAASTKADTATGKAHEALSVANKAAKGGKNKKGDNE